MLRQGKGISMRGLAKEADIEYSQLSKIERGVINTTISTVYTLAQALDNYKFNLLKNKQTFISQMKNCEPNVRTIDEGAIDEKSGMNFSEYIAILSGDTTLLEKSKMEKKIAVLESLKVAHHKEVIRSKFHLESMQADKESTLNTIKKLTIDETAYKSQLQFDKEGAKANPVLLNDVSSVDPEVIGKYLIQLSATWKPGHEESDTMKIGSLYGFELFVRRQRETYDDKGMFEYHYKNILFAESKESGIKYLWNQGHINIDNPKIAARYFINAIDRVDALKEKYQKNLQELEQNIPMLQQLVIKPFEKENELAQFKKDVSKLEREISIKIQENQMKQHKVADEINVDLKPASVIKIDTKGTKSLLPKKQVGEGRVKGVRI